MFNTHIQTETLDNWLSVPENSIEKHYFYNHNRFYFNGYLYKKRDVTIYAIVHYYNPRADEKIREEKNFYVKGWSEQDIDNLFQNPFNFIF